MPNGTLLLPAEPIAIAIGNAPSVVASDVINMGRSLATAASIAAGIFFSPRKPFLVGKLYDQDTILCY